MASPGPLEHVGQELRASGWEVASHLPWDGGDQKRERSRWRKPVERCCGEWEVVRPLWETGCWFLGKLSRTPAAAAVPLRGPCAPQMAAEAHVCAHVCTAAEKRPLRDEWIKK